MSDVFKLLTYGTAFAALVSLLLPRQSLKQQMANRRASAAATPGDQSADASAPALAMATAQPAGNDGYAAPMPATAPERMPENSLPMPPAQRFGPPPGTPLGMESPRMPDPAPPTATSAYPRNGHLLKYEERIAALEQMVASLAEVVQNQPPIPAPSVDEGRIAALEATVWSLDRTVRNLPPAKWHREQYDRTGAAEQRIAALERAVQHLSWSAAPPPPDGRRASTYDTRRRAD